MNSSIQMPVKWNDATFTSAAEARWAIFLDKLGVKWAYRQKKADLPSGAFMPSFWLPERRVWLEVRPALPGAREKNLARELCMATGFAVLLPDGAPTAHWQGTAFWRGIVSSRDGTDSRQHVAAVEDRFRFCFHPDGGEPMLLAERLKGVLDVKTAGDEEAVRKALADDPALRSESTFEIECRANKAKSARLMPVVNASKCSNIAISTVVDLYRAIMHADPYNISFPYDDGQVYKKAGRCMQCGGMDTLQLDVRWYSPYGGMQQWEGPVTWKCRACGANGNLVDYCMQQHGYSREEAMRLLVGSWPVDTPTLLGFAKHAYPQIFSGDSEEFSIEPPEGYSGDITCAFCGGRQFLFKTRNSGERCRAHCLACGKQYGNIPHLRNAGRNKSGNRNQNWSRAVWDRWLGKCAVCGSTENLEAHHIIPWQVNAGLRFCVSNGILLCRKHHLEAHTAFYRVVDERERRA